MATPPAPAQTLAYLRPIFYEEQRFRASRAVVLVLVVLVSVFAIAALTMYAAGGRAALRPGLIIFAIAGVSVVALLMTAKMTTIVDAAGVHVRFVPYLNKTFALSDIIAFEAKKYDPVEYGGWGVRGWPGRYGWAYNVSGNQGVQVEFKNGNRLMLGSQRAEELARAIAEAKGAAA